MIGRFIGTAAPLLFLVFAIVFYCFMDRVAATREAVLRNAGERVVSLKADGSDGMSDRDVVHVAGMVRAGGGAEDPVFGVKADAVWLGRNVLYYQWVEKGRTSSKRGAEYELRWSSAPVDSSKFRVKRRTGNNFVIAEVHRERFPAGKVTLGAYLLDEPVAVKIPSAEKFPVAGGVDADAVAVKLGLNRNRIHYYDSGLYLGATPGDAELGDIKVTFDIAKPGEYSVIGSLRNGRLTMWRDGKLWALVQPGIKTPQEMLSSENLLHLGIRLLMRVVLTVLVIAMLVILKHTLRWRRRGVPLIGFGLAMAVIGVMSTILRGITISGVCFLFLAAAAFALLMAMSVNRQE